MQKNVKEVMDSNGVRILVDLLTLAHLHTNRATVPLQVKTRPQLSKDVVILCEISFNSTFTHV